MSSLATGCAPVLKGAAELAALQGQLLFANDSGLKEVLSARRFLYQ